MKILVRFSLLVLLLILTNCNSDKPATESLPTQAVSASTRPAQQPAATSTNTPAPPPNTPTQPPTETAAPPTQPPTLLPTVSATAVPYTPTPESMATPIPSPTPIPEIHLLNPIIPLEAGQSLPIPYDLLFMTDGRLNLWQPAMAQVTVFTPTIGYTMQSWRTTADQQKVLIAQTATGSQPGFIFSLFDTQTHDLQEVWSDSEQFLLDYDIAADGHTIAVITSPIRPEEPEGEDTVHLLDIASGNQTTIGYCSTYIRMQYTSAEATVTYRCDGLVAVPDSDKWLWSDVVGVWEWGGPSSPALIVPNSFELPPRFYTPTKDWSPNGRYQLLRSRRSKGEDRRVLDMLTHTVVTVPNSTIGLDQAPEWQWTNDNHLFGLQASRSDGEGGYNFAERVPVVEGQLGESDLLAIPDSYGTHITAASQLPDGRFSFIINYNHEAEPTLRNIYLLDSFDQEPYPFVSLPPLLTNWQAVWQSQYWTPDSQTVLYQKIDRVDQTLTYIYYFIPASGSHLIDLTAVLGSNEAQFLWIP